MGSRHCQGPWGRSVGAWVPARLGSRAVPLPLCFGAPTPVGCGCPGPWGHGGWLYVGVLPCGVAGVPNPLQGYVRRRLWDHVLFRGGGCGLALLQRMVVRSGLSWPVNWFPAVVCAVAGGKRLIGVWRAGSPGVGPLVGGVCFVALAWCGYAPALVDCGVAGIIRPGVMGVWSPR